MSVKKKQIQRNEKSGSINKNTYVFIGLLVLFLVFFSYVFNSKLDLNGDNFSYLLLAKSIVQGTGYTDIYSPGTPHASHFPPGYPAILAFFMFFKINSIFFFKILNGLFFLASVSVLYWMMNRFTLNRAFSWIIAILLLMNSGLLSFATIIMSEMSYLFFTCLALFAAYKLADRIDFWKSPYFYVLAASTVMAYYIRNIGIVLLIALLLHFLIKKQWKLSLAFVSSFLLLYLPWIIRNKMYGIEGRYFGTIMVVNPWRPEEGSISTFGEFFQKMLTNFDDTVIKGFREVMFPFLTIDYAAPSGLGEILIGLLLLAVILYGAWQLKPFRYLFILYVLGNIGTFLLWHGGNGARYVHPLSPFIVYFFCWGLLCLVTKIKMLQAVQKRLPYAFLFLAFLSIKPLNFSRELAKSPYPPGYKNYFALAEDFGKMHSKSGQEAVVCARKTTMFSYFSKTMCINYLYTKDTNELIKHLVDNKVDYVVLEQLGYGSTGLYLYPAIMANQELFAVEKHLPNPDTYLFRFNRELATAKLDKH